MNVHEQRHPEIQSCQEDLSESAAGSDYADAYRFRRSQCKLTGAAAALKRTSACAAAMMEHVQQ